MLPDLRPVALELGARESHGARWETPPGALTPQLRIVDGAGSAPEPEKVSARIEAFLAVAAEAWDPFATRGTP